MRGVDERNKLREEVGLDVQASAVYTILSMLEERGFITSSWEVDEKGMPRKIYMVTEECLEYFNKALTRLKEYRRMVEYLLSLSSFLKLHPSTPSTLLGVIFTETLWLGGFNEEPQPIKAVSLS